MLSTFVQRSASAEAARLGNFRGTVPVARADFGGADTDADAVGVGAGVGAGSLEFSAGVDTASVCRARYRRSSSAKGEPTMQSD